MMQQVDLLVPELQPRREHLTLSQLLVVWGAFVAVLLLISSWEGIRAWRLASEQARMQEHFQELARTNEALRSSFSTTPEPELITEVEELRDRFRNQALLVNAVEDYEHASEEGFSGYLRDLAAQHVDGLALSRIELREGGSRILLSGETEAPVNVPRFLKRLSQGESFRGHRFDGFELEALDSGLLRFDITGPDGKRSG